MDFSDPTRNPAVPGIDGASHAVLIWPQNSGWRCDFGEVETTLPAPLNSQSENLKMLRWKAPGDGGEVQLRPRKIYQDPEGRDNYILVLCDAYTVDGNPIPSNNRTAAERIFSNSAVVAQEITFGIKQEYMLRRYDSKDVGGLTGCQGHWALGLATTSDARMLRIAKEHYEACERAGVKISGINGEVITNQGNSALGISIVDDLYAARYILEVIAKKRGLVVLDQNAIPGYLEEAGILIKFSTQSMRNAKGYEAAKIALHKLGMKRNIDMVVSGESNKAKIELQAFLTEAESDAQEAWKGYAIQCKMGPFEMDPYVITSEIAEAVILWKPPIFVILIAVVDMIPFPRCIKKMIIGFMASLAAVR